MMQLSTVYTLLLLMSTLAAPTSAAKTMQQHIQDVSNLLKTIKSNQHFQGFLKVTSTLGKLAKMLGPAGTLVSLAASMFSGESEEMQELRKLHEKTNVVLQEVRNLGESFPAVVANELRNHQIKMHESQFMTVIEHFEAYLNCSNQADSSATTSLRQQICQDEALQDVRTTCADTKFDNIINDIEVMLDDADEREKFYIAHENSYQKVHMTMTYVEEVVIMGSESRSACLYVREDFLHGSHEYRSALTDVDADKWDSQLEDLRIHLGPIRKEKFVERIEQGKIYEKEVEKFMGEGEGLSHKEFAKALLKRLEDKFSFGTEVGFAVLSSSDYYTGSSYQGMLAVNPGTYDKGSLQILAQHGRTVSVFWSSFDYNNFLTQPFYVDVPEWNSLLLDLEYCYPSIPSMKYYYSYNDYYLAYSSYKKPVKISYPTFYYASWEYLFLDMEEIPHEDEGMWLMIWDLDDCVVE